MNLAIFIVKKSAVKALPNIIVTVFDLAIQLITLANPFTIFPVTSKTFPSKVPKIGTTLFLIRLITGFTKLSFTLVANSKNAVAKSHNESNKYLPPLSQIILSNFVIVEEIFVAVSTKLKNKPDNA